MKDWKFWEIFYDNGKVSMTRVVIFLLTLILSAYLILAVIKGEQIDWYGISAFAGILVAGKAVNKAFEAK